ncbi:aliphatic sulfonate ABC transporter substrate-binding protein [Tessaracoccus sp. OH4464_COT-324]|uniref:aliphatic sulfonate ABC transporter substrate-binding protein n=1 Tax=Tessaracoccus sp. OH4464_COT-324 TaxID=2491059 RepID=UPI000F633708|nr:aliphatic sulfonate ABC transporter substrate-binding protein [Tessaracoccus sp. OH4464_COT-324]RRD45945.1 aliphatic sulfonate ABC transporter substrate-binding protein [Tessaracoccus sp. OH4464_COT-324]
MNINRRTLLIGSLGVAGASALSACGGDTPAGVDKIVVGYIADGNGATLVTVANKLDLWKKHGLEVQTKTFTNGPLQVQALGTGDIDFGYIGPGAMWLPMKGDASIVTLNSLGTADRIIAQEGIASLKDLKGKTVGVPEGTSGDMLLNLALEANGMTVDDIKRTPMDPPTTISAFSAGQIDAAAIWYPHVATIKAKVPNLVEVVKSTDFPELAFPAAQVAGKSIAKDKPAVLKKFQAVAKEAFTWAAANREELVKELATFLKAPAESLTSEQEFVDILTPEKLKPLIEDGTVKKWLTTLNKQFIKAGKLEAEGNPDEYFLGAEYLQA